MEKLDGKVAIVTGAGRGVGRGVALALAKAGAKVVIAEVNPETARSVQQEIRQLGGRALGVVCDVGRWEDVSRMVEEAVSTFGPIDILVNNAYQFTPQVPAEEITEAEWDAQFRVGIKGTWNCCRAVFPYMKDRGGKIINFASGAGVIGKPGGTSAVYPAVKEGVRGFTRAWAREWGKYKINMNIICPSAESPGQIEWRTHYPEEAAKVFAERPIKRWGNAERDTGRAVVFLVSEDADFITGQTLIIDGGAVML